MRSRWLLWLLCLVFIVDSCKKDTYTPTHPIKPPTLKQQVPQATFSVSNVLQSNMVVQSGISRFKFGG